MTDPDVDLTPWLKTLDDLPAHGDARGLFSRRGDLEIDVGSGKGLFLLSASQARPGVDFLGVEVSGRYARHAAGRLARAAVENACVLHGDAMRLFGGHLPDAAVAAVHVYFPDPWWKARHKKRRVMNETFARHVQRVLVPGGSLHFWSDVEEYFLAAVQLLREVTELAGPLAVDQQAPEHDLDYRTHFERRMRLTGVPVHRAEFRKTSR